MPVDTSSWPPVARKVYELKSASPASYDYPSMERLRFEMELRSAIVSAANDLSDSGLGFAGFDKSKGNEAFWKRTGDGGFEIRDGVPPAAGIRDIFAHGELYATECATAAAIALYKGILDTIGSEAFNRFFTGLKLYDWHTEGQWFHVAHADPDAAYPGDLLYFRNPDYDPEEPEWQGENVVKLGRDSYYGHPFGVADSETIIAHLNRNRRPGSDKPAYLSDSLAYPDYDMLYALSQGSDSSVIARVGRRRFVI